MKLEDILNRVAQTQPKPVDVFAGLDDDLSAEGNAAHVHHDMRGQLTTAQDALAFMRAGKATVTLVSKKTGTRFTYSLNQSDDKMVTWVKLLVGPDNFANYKYLGRISRDIFWAGRKVPRVGDISSDAPSAKAFKWAWLALIKGTLPDQLEIWHTGRCGKCGRLLTVPESVKKGFGPECLAKIAGG
jgi:hypothetical protein